MVTTKPKDIPQEVPMFLRKTYHMIDSCDPLVAGWSDDGETFVVKDPTKFETEIIPQFFKHSKFTSFVRQLNFYSFRKIKYVDTLRLDPKLEAETANFWRFKHEHFQRGKPHLLMNIKRMTAAQSRAAEKKNAVAINAVATKQPDAVKSTLVNNTNNDKPNGGGVAGGEAVMKEEIDTLKKQLEEMNKNMNQLTTMVQQVSLTSSKETVAVGNKRKKVEFAEPAPDAAAATSTRISSSSCSGVDAALDYLLDAAEDDSDLMLSDMEMDAIISTAVAPAMPIPAPLRSAALSRASSIASNGTDADFVDQLFTAFGSEHGGEDQGDIDVDIDVDGHDTDFRVRDALPEPVSVGSVSSCLPPMAQWREPCYNKNHHNHRSHGRRHYNRPDPELMDRLSEALAVLPKEMQEQIVDRLIASITSNNLFESNSTTKAATSTPQSSSSLGKVPMTEDDDDYSGNAQTPDNEDHTIVGMPLAAATLASLLSYYSQLVKEHRDNNGHHDDDDDDDNVVHDNNSNNNNNNNKIPVIPCHA